MSSVSGLSSSTVNGLRGYGGLASGLDRDSLIEGMTYATQSKIDAQNQKKDLLEWEQEAIQSLTSKMYEFTTKYTSFTSSSNLLGSSIFGRNDVEAIGENSKYLSVTGSNVSSQTVSVLGVKSLAQNASMTTAGSASDRTISSGNISNNLATEVDVNMLEGQTLYFNYGEERYAVTLSATSDYDYSTTEKAVQSINKLMAEVDVEGGKTLADVIEFDVTGTGEAERVTILNKDTGGNRVELDGGTGNSLVALGFESKAGDFNMIDGMAIPTGSTGLPAAQQPKLTEQIELYKQLSGAKMNFEYNGEVKSITLSKFTSTDTMETVAADMNKQLADAFGEGRVEASFTDGKLSFRTTIPQTNDGSGKLLTDDSSTLSIVSADSSLLGAHGLLTGLEAGNSNRVNVNASISNAGLATDNSAIDETQPMIIKNGDVELNLTELGLTWDSSVQEIMDAINENEDLNIKVSYQKESDKFMVESTEQGASGVINLTGNIAEALFNVSDASANNKKDGQDAVIAVKYAGSDTATEITRGSNTISIDGLSITVKDTFGYTGDGSGTAPFKLDPNAEAVTFESSVDVDKATETVKEMVEDYNALLEEIYGHTTEKPNHDYDPLTSTEREELSDDQIELWEEEAKKGLLFNDSDLRNLASDLRFILPLSEIETLREMGISVSTDYTENGKLIFDEEKFKTALLEDPEAVADAFNGEETTNIDGTKNAAGFMNGMKEVLDKYAGMSGSTKGILVERAGSAFSPTTVLDNYIQTQLDDIEDVLDTLADRLESETDRYISQFTQLETLISEMNSQSSYLSSMFTY